MRTTRCLCHPRRMILRVWGVAVSMGARGRRARRVVLAAGLMLPFVFVLEAVAKDTTPPVVKLEIKQGAHWNAVKTATMSSGEPLTVRAVVRDPQGVKSLTVSFPPATSDSCTSAGTVFGGSFPIVLPPNKSRSATSGQTQLVTSVTIPYPMCHVEVSGGHTETGEPIGHTFTIVLVGDNRSANLSEDHAKTRLKVSLQ
jgi:hypothetical protein